MNNKIIQLTFILSLCFIISLLFYVRYNKTPLPLFEPIVKDKLVTQSNNEPYKSLSIVLLSDSHLNSDIFPQLKDKIGLISPDLALHAGDLTNFGTLSEFSKAKIDMDSLDIPYFVIPGDHDIAETSNESNFNQFFKYPSSLVINLKNTKILLIPNFYNFTTLPLSQFNIVMNNLDSSDVIFTSQPIFVPSDNIFADKYMASLTAFENLNPLQKNQLKGYSHQKDQILELIRKSSKPKIVISGDHHRSSTFTDPNNSLINYHILGSLSKYIYFGNTQLLQTSLQSNRFSVLDILDNSSSLEYKIREVQLK